MKLSSASKDVLIELPGTEEWIHAYLHRGWVLVEKHGKSMLK
jgi:hypothetical protein